MHGLIKMFFDKSVTNQKKVSCAIPPEWMTFAERETLLGGSRLQPKKTSTLMKPPNF